MRTKQFWESTAERAVRTFAQSLVALIGVNAVSIMDLDWQQYLGVSATSALLSLLTSVAASGVGDAESPSLVGEGVIEGPPAH